MPYKTEHACRLKDPAQFKTCRRTERTSKNGKVYSVLTCEKKALPGRWLEQAYRYHKDKWTARAARAHCEQHSGFFEEARELVKLSDLPEMKLVRKR